MRVSKNAPAIQSLKRTPRFLRSFVARGLKWIDDRFWGVVPNKRVRWLGYDTGIRPGEQACTIEGCTADHTACPGAGQLFVKLFFQRIALIEIVKVSIGFGKLERCEGFAEL